MGRSPIFEYSKFKEKSVQNVIIEIISCFKQIEKNSCHSENTKQAIYTVIKNG